MHVLLHCSSFCKVHGGLVCSVRLHGKVIPCRAAATCLLPTLPLGLPLLADMCLPCMTEGCVMRCTPSKASCNKTADGLRNKPACPEPMHTMQYIQRRLWCYKAHASVHTGACRPTCEWCFLLSCSAPVVALGDFFLCASLACKVQMSWAAVNCFTCDTLVWSCNQSVLSYRGTI